jgi:hypothetical protein
MIYSYTQISQYLRCPRSYRYRYLDGWREKDTRAAMVFGRCFERALGAYFQHQDCTAALFKEWDAFRDTPFVYRKGESWDRLLHQGVHLLEKFAREDRVCVPHPKENLQLRRTRALNGGNDFVSYIDAIGELVACRGEIVSMGFREKVGPNSWNPPCVNLLLAFGCGDRSNIFSATGH